MSKMPSPLLFSLTILWSMPPWFRRLKLRLTSTLASSPLEQARSSSEAEEVAAEPDNHVSRARVVAEPGCWRAEWGWWWRRRWWDEHGSRQHEWGQVTVANEPVATGLEKRRSTGRSVWSGNFVTMGSFCSFGDFRSDPMVSMRCG